MDAQRILDESKIRIACAETLGYKWFPSWTNSSQKTLALSQEEADTLSIGRWTWSLTPGFLHDANAALLLVEKAKGEGFAMELHFQERWACFFGRGLVIYAAYGDTFCAAVCEAWLRLCGKWEEVTTQHQTK
jgi:hypothetical protein